MRAIVHGKRQWFFLAALGILLLAAAFSIFFRAAPTSAGQAQNLRGFAWSDTVGWISFNCLNDGPNGCVPPFGADYGVDVNAAGQFSGFAWSDNVGWISFEPNHVAGCPGPPCRAQTDPNTGVTTGWARACAGTIKGDCTGVPRTDGWDGWISLSGADYGVTFDLPPACSFSGYAWGSDVVGWIKFSSATLPPDIFPYGVTAVGGGCGAPPLAVSCEAKPNPVFVNRETTWMATANGGDGNYSYAWTFDDGTNSNLNPVKKSYDTVGLHTADVTVTDGNGDQASENCTVNVIRYRREIRPEPL